jgi:hypothetical protein
MTDPTTPIGAARTSRAQAPGLMAIVGGGKTYDCLQAVVSDTSQGEVMPASPLGLVGPRALNRLAQSAPSRQICDQGRRRPTAAPRKVPSGPAAALSVVRLLYPKLRALWEWAL